jgi:hypothetical protein
LYILGTLHGLLNAALFSNLPLKETIAGICKNQFKIPLFATAAQIVSEYIDPDDYILAKPHPRVPQYSPVPKAGLLPVYMRVDQLETRAVIEALLASAALPLGIVANTRSATKKLRFVDGGVTDNTPWFPLIDQMNGDELVVVLCGPVEEAQELPITTERWQQRDRLLRVMTEEHNIPGYTAKTPFDRPPEVDCKNDPPTVVPYRKPNRSITSDDPKIVIIAPAKSLGNLWHGTLNFKLKDAQSNIDLGRRAALQVLASGRLA